MVRELVRRGWSVRGVDLEPCPSGWQPEDVRRVFRGESLFWERYDLTVHCAYHVGGRRAIDGNPLLLALNLELDAQMFDWAVRTGQRVLYFSSSAAYPVRLQTREWVSAHGEHRLCEGDINLGQWSKTGDWSPDARYGWAKLTGEYLALSAGEHIPVHVVRPFSGYGVDQDLCYPFPAILDRARRWEPGDGGFVVWGPSGQTRDWIHISDVVRGALAVVEADERRPVNLCTGVGTEFGDLARMVLRAMGKHAGIWNDPSKPTGVMHRVGDPARMLELYRPQVLLEDVVREATR
jgi:nucleoside-diphosphate-sugar epimerase